MRNPRYRTVREQTTRQIIGHWETEALAKGNQTKRWRAGR